MAPALPVRSLSGGSIGLLAGSLLSCATSAAPAAEPTHPRMAAKIEQRGSTESDTARTGAQVGCGEPAALADRIVLDRPALGEVVGSPLHIVGQARGGWYFEADFPVALYADDGTLLSQGIAHAVGDWMTPDFVPFESTLMFEAPTGGGGRLVLIKDNPSDDRTRDASLCIPVRF